MASERPPRRPRAGKKPASIDLKAGEVTETPAEGGPVPEAAEKAIPALTETPAAVPAENLPEAEAASLPEQPGIDTTELPAPEEPPGIEALAAGPVPEAAERDIPALTETPAAVPVENLSGPEAASLPEQPGIDTTELPAPEEPPEELTSAEALAAEPVPETAETENLASGPDASVADAPEEGAPVAAAPAPAPQKRGLGTSGALAAGIVGGLVALLGAGSMQYAGYLPNIGPAAQQPVAPAFDASALEGEIAALRERIETLAAAPAPAAPEIDTSALEARIAALEEAPAPEPGEPAPAVDLGPLEEKIAALEGGVATLEGALARAEESRQDGETRLLDRLQALETQVADPSRDMAVARAIAASGLKAAIDRGGSFATELETFAGVAQDDDPAIAGLGSFAASGVPTRAELVLQFPNVANAVLAALHRPDPNEDILTRLWSSAASLVRVRPVGDVEGETPEAFLARAEERLKDGDLEGALAEWNRLPEEGKAAAPQFGQALAARIDVETLVGATLKDAIDSAAQTGN